MTDSSKFGKSLAAAFARESRSSRFSEIEQFRALMRAFGALRGKFKVEEFHGAKHQVYFNGHGAWARKPARCELCDLAIFSYSANGGFRGRLTFLQAKLEKELELSDSDLLGYVLAGGIPFKANLEQWDLLSRRPDVLPVPPFATSPRLLSGSALASVGSFGIFHRMNNAKEAGMFYSCADCLVPQGTSSTRYGKLLAESACFSDRIVDGHVERTFCRDVASFGKALFQLEIGTPVENVDGNDPGNAYRSELRTWLARTVAAHAASSQRDSVIANELRGILPDPGELDDQPSSVPSLVVIRSDHPQLERRG